MVSENEVQIIKKELANDNRDVADLWTDALRKYKGIVGEDLLPKFTSVDAMIKFGSSEMDNFHSFRHNSKKVDKLRSLFAANLDFIQKGAQQLIAAATPAFPPAAAIGTALTYMLSACKQVSADYDVVTAFFEDMNAFLQRITILETRLPKYPAYRNCLMDVFTSVLEMCGFATKYIELGRFKKWIMNMVGGQDGDLGGARKKMDTSLSRLQSATEYAILGNTEELQRMNTDLQQNQDMQTRMMEDQTKMLEDVLQSQDSVRSDLQNIQKLLVMFDERRGESSKQRAATKPSGTNQKPPTSNQVRSFFLETMNPAHEYYSVKESFIPDTCNWIFDEPLWDSWHKQEPGTDAPRILALLGPPGSGKSHLAASIYDRLVSLAETYADTPTCVVHFYFRETTKDLSDIYKAVNWAVIQMTEQNAAICEKICAELQREDLELDGYDPKDVWTKLVQPCFTTTSKAHLKVVWDGLDELEDGERDDLWKFFTLVKDTPDQNVTFVCTSRKSLQESFQTVGAQIIEVTKEKQLPDMKALIWHHLNNDSGLRKLSKPAKQSVSSTLEEKADGLLYADHLLRQFGIYAREPLVLKALAEHMPEGLEGLYLNMVADLQHHTPDDELQAMKTLFCWLAHCYRPLTLAECLSLIEITSNTSFDLERELQGRQLARILRLGDLEERMTDTAVEDVKLSIANQTKVDVPLSDGDLPLKFQERSMAGFFRSKSEGLRTVNTDGHREMFILCSDIVCGRRLNAHKDLKQYAARYWMIHLSWTNMSKDSEHDRIRALNALGTLMSNETNAATVIEELGVDYDEINEEFTSGLLMQDMAYFAQLAAALGNRMSTITQSWAKSVTADVHTAFEQLAKGHIRNWFQAEEPKLALRSFKFARSALNMKEQAEVKPEEDNDETNNDDEDDNGDQNGNDDIFAEQSHYTVKEIMTVCNAFEDIPKERNAFRVVALLLYNCKHYDAAITYAQRAQKLLAEGDHILRFRVQSLLAQLYLSKKDLGRANETLQAALSRREALTPKLITYGLITRARIESAQGRKEEAIATYEEARVTNPDEPISGGHLQQAFKLCMEQGDDAKVVDLIKKWKPMERLASMTWNYDDAGFANHEILRRVVARAGQEEYLYQVYEEAIKLLENVDAAPPIKYHLAIARATVGMDLSAAKVLLYEILDTTSNGDDYALTDQDPAYMLICAVSGLTEIIYEQYRASTDVTLKAELYGEIQNLTKKPLARSIAPYRSGLMHHTLTTGRMARKMASAQVFQEILNNAFNLCYEALIDDVGWNDMYNTMMLAVVVSSLPGMEREAQILVSAQFSTLDAGVKELPEPNGTGGEGNVNGVADTEEKGDGQANEAGGESTKEQSEKATEKEADDEDEDEVKDDAEDAENDYPLPTDEGDLDDIYNMCSGECKPWRVWRAWKGRPMYLCLICDNTALCEDCHSKRQQYNQHGGNEACRASAGAYYCGTNHRYIKAPVAGWKGIKDGIMTVEGQNGEETIKVKFRDWLDELKNVKWKAAWERFWLNEE